MTGILLVCMYVQSPCSVFYLVVIDKWIATDNLGLSLSEL